MPCWPECMQLNILFFLNNVLILQCIGLSWRIRIGLRIPLAMWVCDAKKRIIKTLFLIVILSQAASIAKKITSGMSSGIVKG